jgi:ribosome-binding ATPase YchF (GTP1/OBG family)
LIKPYNLLTYKPFIYAINVGTEDFAAAEGILQDFAGKLNRPVTLVCAKLESEMLGFSTEEREEYCVGEF